MIVCFFLFIVVVVVVLVVSVVQDLFLFEKVYWVELCQVGQGVVEFDYQIVLGYIFYKDCFSVELVGVFGCFEVELLLVQIKLDYVINYQVDFYCDCVMVWVKLFGGQVKFVVGVVVMVQGCVVEVGVCYLFVKVIWVVQGVIDVEVMIGCVVGCQSYVVNKF